jgi:hypothetical protein
MSVNALQMLILCLCWILRGTDKYQTTCILLRKHKHCKDRLRGFNKNKSNLMQSPKSLYYDGSLWPSRSTNDIFTPTWGTLGLRILHLFGVLAGQWKYISVVLLYSAVCKLVVMMEMYVWRDVEVRMLNSYCRWKAINIRHSAAKLVHRIIYSSLVCSAVLYFCTI